jgi:hypothetical protein
MLIENTCVTLFSKFQNGLTSIDFMLQKYVHEESTHIHFQKHAVNADGDSKRSMLTNSCKNTQNYGS